MEKQHQSGVQSVLVSPGVAPKTITKPPPLCHRPAGSIVLPISLQFTKYCKITR